MLKNEKWKLKVVNKFGEVLMESVLRPKAENVLGLKMHFTDIYLEELAKVSWDCNFFIEVNVGFVFRYHKVS